MHLLIDGDILVYRAAFASQQTSYRIVDEAGKVVHEFAPKITLTDIKKEYTPEKKTGLRLKRVITASEPALACYNCKMILAGILNNLDVPMHRSFGKKKENSYSIYLTSDDKSNFRFKEAKTLPYKGNRKDFVKPVHYGTVRNYLKEYWSAVTWFNIEADDQIAHEQQLDKDNNIICSIDKDFLQNEGYYYNIVDKKLKWITKEEACRFYNYQLVYGDSVDNIPGYRHWFEGRLGPVAVNKVLDCYPAGNKNPHNLLLWLYNESGWKPKKELTYDEMMEVSTEMYDLIRLGVSSRIKSAEFDINF